MIDTVHNTDSKIVGFDTMLFKLVFVKKAYPLMSDYFKIKNPDSTNLNFTRAFNFEDSKVKPNVVLVICESFSAYKSSMFGNKLNPTPYFNQMCNEGVFFERCFTPAFGTAIASLTFIVVTSPIAKTFSNEVIQSLFI